MDHAKKMARTLAEYALQTIKGVVNEGAQVDIKSALANEMRCFALLFSTQDKKASRHRKCKTRISISTSNSQYAIVTQSEKALSVACNARVFYETPTVGRPNGWEGDILSTVCGPQANNQIPVPIGAHNPSGYS